MLSSSESLPEDNALENMLAAHADAMLRKPSVKQEDFDFLYDEYGLTSAETAEVGQLLMVAHRLNDGLMPVTPSDEFVLRLKNDLVGKSELTLLLRWRKLPPMYRVAASLGGLTLTAGILFVAARQVVEVVSSVQRRKSGKNLSLTTAS